MEIEIFTLADFAQDNHSKLTIVGTFDSIYSKQFPVMHPSCSVAIRLRFAARESGQHDFRLRLIDAKGKEIIQAIEGNIDIPVPANDQAASVNVVANFAQLKFESPGKYAFELYVDGDWKSGLPFYLSRAK
jgi:hypothetical protein